MILEGDIGVIDAIKEKKRLMDAGEPHDHIRPLLIGGGGFMKGSYGIGALQSLTAHGHQETFTAAVGISSGSPMLAYFLAGQMDLSARLMVEDATSKEFFNFSYVDEICDTEYFMQRVRGEVDKKALDVAALLDHRTDYQCAVTEFDTGTSRLLRPIAEDTLLSAMQASITMPNGAFAEVYIDDVRYVDGGFGKPHPLRRAITENDNITHVLVLGNQDKSTKDILLLEKVLDWTLWRHRMPAALRRAAHDRRKTRHRFVEQMLEQSQIPFCIDWGDESVDNFERDPGRVAAAINRSRTFWNQLLETK